MTDSRIILDENFVVDSRYRVILYALEVPVSKKFPSGVKAKFVLLHAEGYPRLLVDNHEPYGFHMHTRLPEDKDTRVELKVTDHNEAMTIFLQEVERIVKNERE